MKKTLVSLIVIATLAAAVPIRSFAVTSLDFNQNVTAILGSGNPNTGWTTWTDTAYNLQLGLRAKDRLTGATPNNGAGTFLFSTGSYPGPVRNKFNYEFSINVDPQSFGVQKLNMFDFYLSASGPSWSPPTINLLTAYADNSYGDNATANGMGVEGLSSVYAPILNIAQNSQNPVFTGADPNLSGNYLYTLFATLPGAGPNGYRIAQVDMVVSVPEPSSLALLGISSLAFVQRIRRRK
jgi:hypothetical protein